MNRTLIIIISVIAVFACKNENVKYPSTPNGAIPIVYCGYILIPGSVDSVKGNFLLDTGADNLHVDNIFFNENKFAYKNYKNGRLSGIGNSFQKATLILDTFNLQFNNSIYRTSNIVVHSIKPIGGDYIDGLIGLKYFYQKILEVNYLGQYIFIHNSTDSVDLSGFVSIPFEIIAGRKCIPIDVKINKKVSFTGRFMIDLGSPGSSVTSSFAQKINLSNKIEHKVEYYTKYGGIGGYSSGFDFIADSLQISGFTLHNVNMSYSSDTSGVMATNDFLGILGNNVLDRFDVIFDFKDNYLYLKPNAKFSLPYESDRLGFSFVVRNKTMGGWIVTGLSKNSPAEKQGLLIDDKIISVNEISIKRIPFNLVNDFFRKLDKVKFVVNRGEKTVIIEFNLVPLL